MRALQLGLFRLGGCWEDTTARPRVWISGTSKTLPQCWELARYVPQQAPGEEPSGSRHESAKSSRPWKILRCIHANLVPSSCRHCWRFESGSNAPTLLHDCPTPEETSGCVDGIQALIRTRDVPLLLVFARCGRLWSWVSSRDLRGC